MGNSAVQRQRVAKHDMLVDGFEETSPNSGEETIKQLGKRSLQFLLEECLLKWRPKGFYIVLGLEFWSR